MEVVRTNIEVNHLMQNCLCLPLVKQELEESETEWLGGEVLYDTSLK